MSGTLYAGIPRRIINPMLGARRVGVRLFGDAIQGIESDLTATILVLSNEDNKVAIIGVDLCVIGNAEASEFRAGVAQRLGIPISHVMLNLTHNHGASALPDFMLDTPEDMALKVRYKHDLAQWLAECAVEANDQLQPARIGVGWGECTIGVYRREFRDGRDVLGEDPTHPIDPSVGVIRVDHLEGNPLAILFRYSCHALTVGPRSCVASSDYPGVARQVLEKGLGGTALFLQGCGGNINPTYGIGYEVDCCDTKQRTGMMLGGEALKVAANIRTNRRPGARKPLGSVPNILFTPWESVTGDTCTYLGAAERMVPFEFIELPSLQEAQAIQSRWQQTLSERRAGDAQEWQIRSAEKYMLWSRILVNAVKQGYATCDLDAQVIRVNDIVIAGLSAEPFFETGLAIQAQSPFKDTFVLGYTNGAMIYLPRAEDYPKDGWKLNESYGVPDLNFQAVNLPVALHPSSEQRAVKATVDLIKELK